MLVTKLYIPPPRPNAVPRHRLIERLNEGLHRKLTLISAPAGFGKSTLVSKWVAGCERPAAWLSLDEGDNDLAHFLTYLVAALQTVVPTIGAGVLGVLHSPQPPPIEAILTTLLNDITTVPDHFVLVLDDYHVLDAKSVDNAFTFLLEHLPPQMHLVIATREDPQLPLARLRARGQMTELRAADLRFTPVEAATFLNQVMGLNLSAEDIAALERRTEGWIAGLQLAAISMRGHQDTTSFIKSFTGSHHFVLDYLLEEVLHQQSASVQTFLLRTSILDRLCGSLCDAILLDSSVSGQATLEYLERANLFIVPLDNERRWYRYHHLFADLLRQRLHQRSTSSPGGAVGDVIELHSRASQWYEDNGLEFEAFHHAVAANDVGRAERLIEGAGVPLHFRGAGAPVLHWLESLPTAVLNARPALWVTYASALMMTGHHTAVEQKLQAAEDALQGAEPDDRPQDLVGRIASMRATVAVIQHDVETIIAQSRRALEYLHPDNLPLRTAANWTLGYAYQLQGDRAVASRAYAEVISISKSFKDSIYTTAATLCLGQVQEAENQLSLAAKTYRRVLILAGDPPRPIACEAHLGLARIYYQWNDLDAAEQHGHQCLHLTRQMESVDTFAACGVFLARLRLAQGDVPGAVAVLDEAEAFVRQHNFVFRMPDLTAAQVLMLLRQGHLAAAAHLAETHELPISQARVHLAQGDPATALALLKPPRQQAEAKGWADERLTVMVLQAVALHMMYSRLIGALFLAGFVVYGVGFGLVTSVLGAPEFLSTISTHQTTLVFGAFLMLLNTVVDVGKGVLFFPILENHGKRTALAYLAALIVQVVLLDVGVLCLLMIVPLGQYAVDAGGASAAWAAALGSLLTQANTMAYQIGQATLGVGGIFLCSLLFRTRLIPRSLAVWGVIGYAIHVAGAIAEIFGIHISLVLLIPGGLFELVLPFWLFIKGFQPEAYGGRAEVVMTPTLHPASVTL